MLFSNKKFAGGSDGRGKIAYTGTCAGMRITDILYLVQRGSLKRI